MLPIEMRIGAWRAFWVWALAEDGAPLSEVGVPVGVVIDHGDHAVLVPWVPVPGDTRQFTLDSLLPLTVVESVTCTTCGTTGRIERGAWLPDAEGGVERG